MTPSSLVVSTPKTYQADWPLELLDKFIKSAGGVNQFAIRNLKNHTSPYYSTHLFNKIPSIGFQNGPLTSTFIRSPNPIKSTETLRNVRNYFCKQRYPGSEIITVKTPDGNTLSGILIPGQLSSNKAILFCNPTGTSMEDMASQFLSIAALTGCTGVIFNQRGIQDSEGKMTPNGFILDAYTMFEFLVNQRGIHANDIVIYGRSMGGGWGAEAAAMIQRKYPWAEINFVSERSFSSLTKEIISCGNWVPGIGNIIGGILSVGGALTYNVFDAKTSAESLKGRVCIIYHKNDWVISHGPFLGMLPGGSLNEKFQIENASCKELLRIELKNNDPTTICYWDKKVNNHDRHFTDPELRAVTITLRRMLNMPEEADFRTPDYVKQMICRESLYWA